MERNLAALVFVESLENPLVDPLQAIDDKLATTNVLVKLRTFVLGTRDICVLLVGNEKTVAQALFKLQHDVAAAETRGNSHKFPFKRVTPFFFHAQHLNDLDVDILATEPNILDAFIVARIDGLGGRDRETGLKQAEDAPKRMPTARDVEGVNGITGIYVAPTSDGMHCVLRVKADGFQALCDLIAAVIKKYKALTTTTTVAFKTGSLDNEGKPLPAALPEDSVDRILLAHWYANKDKSGLVSYKELEDRLRVAPSTFTDWVNRDIEKNGEKFLSIHGLGPKFLKPTEAGQKRQQELYRTYVAKAQSQESLASWVAGMDVPPGSTT